MKPSRRSLSRLSRAWHSSLEPLEARIAPATFTVTTAADSGAGSLRQAILDANEDSVLDTINFNLPGTFLYIPVLSALPVITSPIFLDGSTHSGLEGAPGIALQGYGSGLPTETDGLVISGQGANGSTINGITIVGFPGDGLEIDGSDNNTVTASSFGIYFVGKTGYGGENGGSGILLKSADHNTLGGGGAAGLWSSGNSQSGIELQSSSDNKILGSKIGTDWDGKTAFPNSYNGISINDTLGNAHSVNNVIGQPGAGNVISGNTGSGILVGLSAGTIIQSNIIGLAPDGATNLHNNSAGISVSSYVQNTHITTVNQIGGAGPGEGNIISGNTIGGISAQSTKNLVVQGNFIGTDKDGNVVQPTKSILGTGNNRFGIRVVSSTGITIGGTAAGTGNVVSGNGSSTTQADTLNEFGGLVLDNSTSSTVAGNFIGTDATGTKAAGNLNDGIRINGGSKITIGGAIAGARNIISGNGYNPGTVADAFRSGITITGANTATSILGNYIGTDVTGTQALGNRLDGICIGATSTSAAPMGVQVGGTSGSPGNVISGNGVGIEVGADRLSPSATIFNTQIGNNFIGTDATGHAALDNGTGILLNSKSSSTNIGFFRNGGAEIFARNVISGNRDSGIAVGGDKQLIKNNFIGVDVTGAQALGNGENGIYIGYNAPKTNAIVVNANIISANGFTAKGAPGAGVIAIGTSIMMAGNTIGLNLERTAALGNAGAGISVMGTGSNVTIGGSSGNENRIGGNGGDGITVNSPNAGNITIKNNYIGGRYGEGAISAFPNGGNGIRVTAAAALNVTINANAINGNMGAGILIDPQGSASIGSNEIAHNGSDGVTLHSSTSNGVDLAGNEIHDNDAAGVFVTGSGFANITANHIFANGSHGIDVESSSARSVTIRENTVTANHGAGVGVGAQGHAIITRNEIFGNDGLAIDLGKDGPTANDPLDADTGANDLVNSATLRSAFLRYGATLLRGSFDGAPMSGLGVEIFTYSLDAQGHETGSSFLREVFFSTDVSGHASLSIDLAELPPGTRLGVAVTDLSAGTSEFSYIATATPPDVFAVGTGAGSAGAAALVKLEGTNADILLSIQPYGAKFRGGVNVAHADVDHDGVDDLITAPRSGTQPVRVFSGFDGALLASWTASPAHFTGGVTVAAGDVNGDGVAEIITALGQGGAPRVTVHEALSGVTKSSFLAFAAATRTGVNLTVGDLDGDERAEIVASTATSRAAIHVFHGDGSSAGPVIRPFAKALSFGTHVAIYQPDATMAPLLAVGSGAGTRSSVGFYTLAGKIAFPAIRVAGLASIAPVNIATVPALAPEFGAFALLVTGTDTSTTIEIRTNPAASPILYRPFDLPNKIGLTLG